MATDNFTAANGTGLEAHDAKWTDIDSTYAATKMEIQANAVQNESSWAYGGAFYSDGQSADQSSEIIDKAHTSSSKHVAARCSTGSRGYSLNFGSPSGGNWTTLLLNRDGAWIATVTTGGTWAQASDHTLKIQVSGGATTTIDSWVDGVAQTQKTDSTTPITTGYPGFWHDNNAATPAQTAFDDWTDGIGAGGALLDAAVSCAGTVVAALTTAITMAASVAASGVIAAVLTTSILLGGAVTGSASAAASLTTDIRLDATPTAAINATGALTTAIPLNAAVTASVTQASELTIQPDLFTADVTASATATAELTVGRDFDAAVNATIIASPTLTTEITFSSGVSATAVAAGELTTEITLDAAPSASVTQASSLTTAITFAANPNATVTVAASLASVIIATPAERTLKVASELQTLAIRAEDRTSKTVSEQRTLIG